MLVAAAAVVGVVQQDASESPSLREEKSSDDVSPPAEPIDPPVDDPPDYSNLNQPLQRVLPSLTWWVPSFFF